MLRGGDGVSEHGAVSGQELDDVWWHAALPEDFIHGVAGRHGGVTRLPEDDVTLEDMKTVRLQISHS